MDSFIKLLKVLFLGKAVLLTPNPIELDKQWLDIELEEPLEAITAGAALEVRFPRQHSLFVDVDSSNELYEVASSALPQGSIEAKLVDENGDDLVLSQREISISKSYVSYGLVGENQLSTEISYEALKVRSSFEIQGVKVFWRNFKH